MKGHVAKNLKPATVRDYRDMQDRFILPEIGSVPIDELRRTEIKALSLGLLDKTYTKGTDADGNSIRRSYTKTTAHHIAGVMRAILNHAIEDELVSVNHAARPGRFVKLPKRGSKADVLSPEEMDHLLESSEKHYPDLYPLLFTLFRTSLRKGEVRALQWGDLDFHGGFLMVQRAFSKGLQGEGEILSTPKSGEIRNMGMGDKLMVVLINHKSRCSALALKRRCSMPEWVFSNRQGKPLADGTVNKYLNRCLAKSGLRQIRVHDVRHTVISQHLEAGTSLEEAKRLAGHTTIKLTSDTYGHKIRVIDRELANRLDNMQRTGKSATYPQPVTELQDCEEVSS